ncbi:MAG: DUF2239 family protein [Coriobacteriia bacterium]|nr:DUF2239 family protein [Coriobacteriia bacterium]
MNTDLTRTCIAFAGSRCLERGRLAEVALAAKAELDARPDASVFIFDDETSEPVEIDFRGDARDVMERLAAAMAPAEAVPAAREHRSPGRPKLGVVAREVTLLPRHWEWLAAQPGGASVTLRKLVEEARRSGVGDGTRRTAQEAAFRFMNAVAGNEPGFEEAVRALYAGDAAAFASRTDAWAPDVRDHAHRLAERAF